LRPQALRKTKKWIADIFIITIAALIFSLGLNCFTAPNDIAPGGVVGIATIINSFLPVSIGLLYAAFNVPLILIGVKFLGKKRMVKTLVSVGVIVAQLIFYT
jgi:uncharacterized membrane-anchored protein YitT (DUF2179 family)